MRFMSVMLGLLCLPALMLAALIEPTVFPIVAPLAVLSILLALALVRGRFYLMTETAWAQITAVGVINADKPAR